MEEENSRMKPGKCQNYQQNDSHFSFDKSSFKKKKKEKVKPKISQINALSVTEGLRFI